MDLLMHLTRALAISLCLFYPVSVSASRTSDASPAFPFHVTRVDRVAQLIGPTPNSIAAPYAPASRSINNTMKWGICSGDLGSLIYAQGKAYITLGDNYASCPPGTGGPGGDLRPPDWRSNALGIIPNPRQFTHGLRITHWFNHDGKRAAEVLHSAHDAGNCEGTSTPGCEITKIPTYGFATQGRLFLAFMSVHHWGDPGTWDVNYSSLAMSSSQGKSWKIESRTIKWAAGSNFAQVAVTPDVDGRHLLFYGIPGGRFGSAKLMRCPDSWRAVLDPHTYEYFAGIDDSGRPRWKPDMSSAIDVVEAPVGELSVIFDARLKVWLMTYLQGSGDLVIRSASQPWGPWSQAATLASQQRFPELYGAFMNSHFVTDGGRSIYFVMSQWLPYCVFWMRATLSPVQAPRAR